MDEEFVVETWHYVLAKHAKAMCALERELGERHGIGPSEFEVLDRIVHHDRKLRIQELCEEVHLSQSALSRVVARLEKNGLVTRGTCHSDRRGVFVWITDEGRERHTEALPTQRAVLADVFTDVPAVTT
ncbi:MarR family winged helix-turn-helix transcriptional regulator [Nonomuraea sp. NPDC052265]|uniref:MarR family winged helix-turn-helix transcriptional regulator n=1 Tax=Nonomuraea sp. NPDC052265 TaxID=3364374 RepID=UPI0037C80C87